MTCVASCAAIPAVSGPSSQRLIGSPDLYAHANREAQKTVNFVTCHDGFTLADLVSYDRKHNEANGEDNRDGTNDNLSWNGGAEGATDDPAILELRRRQAKNLLTLTLLAVGVPMLTMGDEVLRSQNGNNNAYCQDNELSWFDWSAVEREAGMLRFTASLIAARRRAQELLDLPIDVTLEELLATARIDWHGVALDRPDRSHDSRSLAVTISGRSVALHIIANAYWEPLDFALPRPADGRGLAARPRHDPRIPGRHPLRRGGPGRRDSLLPGGSALRRGPRRPARRPPGGLPVTTPTTPLDPERERMADPGHLEEGLDGASPWYLWGPYVAERAWGTVREDYSADGDAWSYFPHDHARSRAYRWNEDGMAGLSDVFGRLCLGLALWNGRDPILKERMFGLANSEGNHGEDAKDYWWYLDALPSSAWLRWRYHYPQAEFPYEDLLRVNRERSKLEGEYELLDTGVFDAGYWVVEVDYAKADPTDILMRITDQERGARGRHAPRPADALVPQHVVVGGRHATAVDHRDRSGPLVVRDAPRARRLRARRRTRSGRQPADGAVLRERDQPRTPVRPAADHGLPEGRDQRPRRPRCRQPWPTARERRRRRGTRSRWSPGRAPRSGSGSDRPAITSPATRSVRRSAR